METINYLEQVISILRQIQSEEFPKLECAANWIFETVRQGHCVYFYGCTHAGILTQEAFYRTGGLAIINPIFAPGTLVSDSPITLTSSVERLDGYGSVVAEQSGIGPEDLLFIHSVSGRNNVPIDLAVAAKERGAQVVCITGMDYTTRVQSRHWSGKNLYELCDLVIDNHCPYGDALVQLSQDGLRAGPGSTVVGVAIWNQIVTLAAKRFEAEGMVPPVFASANIDGGEERNLALYKLYRKNIRYKMV
ncbi:MAG: SIS domain-containing protein [Clostridiales bacterium]|nr:SIS domain-containing protein [Clostridiales bacterium]